MKNMFYVIISLALVSQESAAGPIGNAFDRLIYGDPPKSTWLILQERFIGEPQSIYHDIDLTYDKPGTRLELPYHRELTKTGLTVRSILYLAMIYGLLHGTYKLGSEGYRFLEPHYKRLFPKGGYKFLESLYKRLFPGEPVPETGEEMA